ncbi:MAG: DUF5668 domain-containing protein [Clostridium sp.]|uniref:LiaI-LiaF-like domain-containing protein n=1 Tax=Clostridium sp. TaxID=1506 RepID=UPI0039ECB57D
MRKIGTLTLALSLIYYGIWMALRNVNPLIAKDIFLWWPVIFVLLGIEVLFNLRKSEDIRKMGFNVGLIFMILVFFITNLFYQRYSNPFNSIGNIKNNLIESNWDINAKSIYTTKTIIIKNNKFQFQTTNGNLDIKRSADNNVKLDLNVRVKEDSDIKKYDINEQNENDLTKVDIDENYIKGVEGTLFIPDGADVNIVIDNLNINSADNLTDTVLNIDAKNGKFTVSNVAHLGIQAFNGDVRVNDVKDTSLKVDNGKFNIAGNMENVDVNMKNASVDIDNSTFKNININGNNGAVRVNTKDNNIDANLTCNMGECNFNGEKINRGTLTKTTGNGSSKIKASIDIGSVRVNSQE